MIELRITGIADEHPHMSIQEEGARNDRERSSDLDDETFARLIQEQLNMDIEKTDEEYARYLQVCDGHKSSFLCQCTE